MAGLGHRPVLSLMLCLAVASASPRYRRQLPSSLSLSTSSFGTSLYKRLASGNEDNIICSPLSVFTTLSMVLLGAGGDTEQELRMTLAVQSGQNVHSDLRDLMTSMTTSNPDSNLTLRMANALYYNAAQVVVLESYAANTSQYYGAGLQPFQRPNPELAINAWVEQVTERAITDFLPPDSIDPSTVLMLLNAVFFEASWRTMFEPTSTRNANFTTVSGVVKQVSMMYKLDRFSVKSVPELEARVLELPYKGGDYSLFIILPNRRNGIRQLERDLNGQNLESVVTSMPLTQRCKVYVPKFYLRTRRDLIASLQALGLRAMFDSSRANFSGIFSEASGLEVSEAIHEAMIEVTESGTKAAAVTMIGIRLISADFGPGVPVFRADRPFLFVLRDKLNGVNLFMGRVADPSQSQQ